MPHSIRQIAEATGAVFLQAPQPDAVIHHLLLDSRQVIFPETSLFVAIPGQRHNGHAYIRQVYDSGVRHFLVSEKVDTQPFPDANFLQAADTTLALQQIAAFHRSQFDYPVLGITGSNGKTIVKEWLFQVLQSDRHIARSPRSYNSQVGVPLSVWEMHENHDLAIFEAGISTTGEMKRLAGIIACDIGVFTNIGDAHNEGFASVEEKIREKLQLFEKAHTIVYRRDDPRIQRAMRETYPDRRLFAWSDQETADLQIVQASHSPQGTAFTARFDGKSFPCAIPFSDQASFENACHCLAVLLLLGYSPEACARRLARLEPVAMRLELKTGAQQCTIINDSYNSDLTSLNLALQFLRQQGGHPQRTLILSDILQTGEPSPVLYRKVAALIRAKGVGELIGIGREIPHIREFLSPDTQAWFYPDTGAFLRNLEQHSFRNRAILLKGAREFHFESIANRLAYKAHKTVLEIRLHALLHNLYEYHRLLGPGVRLLVMVKASGYGSGSEEVARLLQFHKVDYLGVAYADEGVELRKAGIRLPILVLNPDEASFDAIFRFDLEPEIYSLRQMRGFLEAIPEGTREFPIHLKIETGMNRLGFGPEDFPELTGLLANRPEVQVRSIFSHLAASEDPAQEAFTHQQAERFNQGYEILAQALGYQPLRHLLNSAGISRYPQYHFDMVRLGIGIYGIDAAPERQKRLEPALVLKATISQIKNIPQGQTVGYGRRGVLSGNGRIATISIGYADGFLRLAGNGRYSVSIRGKLAPTVGNICMDMCMVDITGIPEAEEGDEVIVFGAEPTVFQLSKTLQTIPYEVFTNISERVRRVYVQE